MLEGRRCEPAPGSNKYLHLCQLPEQPLPLLVDRADTALYNKHPHGMCTHNTNTHIYTFTFILHLHLHLHLHTPTPTRTHIHIHTRTRTHARTHPHNITCMRQLVSMLPTFTLPTFILTTSTTWTASFKHLMSAFANLHGSILDYPARPLWSRARMQCR